MSEILRPLTERSITQNGHITLPGGLILQWGNTPAIAGGAQATITFGIPFPNGIFQLVATGGSSGNTTAASGYTIERNGTSKADFILRNWGGEPAGRRIMDGYRMVSQEQVNR